MIGALSSCSSAKGAMRSEPISGRPVVWKPSLDTLVGDVERIDSLHLWNLVRRLTLALNVAPVVQCRTS